MVLLCCAIRTALQCTLYPTMWSAQHVRHRRQALPAVGIAVVPCGTRAAGLAVEVGARAAGRRRRRRRRRRGRRRRRRGDDAADEDSHVI